MLFHLETNLGILQWYILLLKILTDKFSENTWKLYANILGHKNEKFYEKWIKFSVYIIWQRSHEYYYFMFIEISCKWSKIHNKNIQRRLGSRIDSDADSTRSFAGPYFSYLDIKCRTGPFLVLTLTELWSIQFFFFIIINCISCIRLSNDVMLIGSKHYYRWPLVLEFNSDTNSHFIYDNIEFCGSYRQ